MAVQIEREAPGLPPFFNEKNFPEKFRREPFGRNPNQDQEDL
jgi:hypothetical protein